jgi:hypothetical protein
MDDDWRSIPRRIEDGMNSVLLGIGLFTFTFVASQLLATKTNLPTGSLFVDMATWTAALFASGWLILFAAKHLRASNFGDAPPRNPPDRQDLIGYAVTLLAGPLLLVWFLPRIYELHIETQSQLFFELRARWVDALLVGVGLVCIAIPVRAFIRYITRR